MSLGLSVACLESFRSKHQHNKGLLSYESQNVTEKKPKTSWDLILQEGLERRAYWRFGRPARAYPSDTLRNHALVVWCQRSSGTLSYLIIDHGFRYSDSHGFGHI